MDAATLKLLSLAEIVERLMKKNPPPFRWSAEAESLPSQLRSLPLEELLQVSTGPITMFETDRTVRFIAAITGRGRISHDCGRRKQDRISPG